MINQAHKSEKNDQNISSALDQTYILDLGSDGMCCGKKKFIKFISIIQLMNLKLIISTVIQTV
jgi:hypothetical protein